MSESSFSWYFSDNGIGTSVDYDTITEFSAPDTFEQQIVDLHGMREKLFEEDNKREEILSQIDRKSFGRERLEAERAILSTTLRTEMLLNDFREKCGVANNNFCNIGTVTISNLKVQCNEANCKKLKKYFVCAIDKGGSLFLSQICEPEGNVVNFDINHTFLHMSLDFKISIKIFVLTHQLKTIWQKINKNLFTACLKTSELEPVPKRSSMFKFCKEAIVTISDVNQTKEIFLKTINSSLFYEVKAEIDLYGINQKGWLDVSRNGLFWNQRWCVLEKTKLKCYNDSGDECCTNPAMTINLTSCISAKNVAGVAFRKIIALEMDQEEHNPFFFYLSTASNTEFHNWLVLERLVPSLQRWKETGSCVV